LKITKEKKPPGGQQAKIKTSDWLSSGSAHKFSISPIQRMADAKSKAPHHCKEELASGMGSKAPPMPRRLRV